MKILKNVNGEKLLKRTQLNDHPLPSSARPASAGRPRHGKGLVFHPGETLMARWSSSSGRRVPAGIETAVARSATWDG